MAPRDQDRTAVANEIGRALKIEQILEVVLKATGGELFVIFASQNDPVGRAVFRTLKQLANEGTERWLLTYALGWAIADERLRRIIVKFYPKTLMELPSPPKQVEGVLGLWKQVLPLPLSEDLRDELRERRTALSGIVDEIAELVANSSLHERLNNLHNKLTVASALNSALDLVGDSTVRSLEDRIAQVEATCAEARKLVGHWSCLEPELEMIGELEGLAGKARAHVRSNDAQAPIRSNEVDAVREIHTFVRFHLTRLSSCVFNAAKRLSLHAMVDQPPVAAMDEMQFKNLAYAVRDLNPTILAHSLLHKIWQEIDNEAAFLADLLEQSDRAFAEHWLTLNGRVRWLASLEPDAEWSQTINQYSKDISDRLADEKPEILVKPLFEGYRRTIHFQFFEFDGRVSSDFSSLNQVAPAVATILKDLDNVR